MLFLYLMGVWLASALAGAAIFPLLYCACPRLKDHGYSIARVCGLVGITFFPWLLSSLGIAPFGSISVISALVLIAALSFLIARGRLKEIGSFFVQTRQMILSLEAIGLVCFLIILRILSFNPEIAPETERFMDYALLNRIDQTSYFPPQDPWMAGETMNYYYYGYILISALHKIIPIPLPVFFNLSLGLIYSLFILGAFGMGFNLTGKISYGILGAILLMIIGNLYGFIQVMIPRQETINALIAGGQASPGTLGVIAKQFNNFGFFDGARVMVQTAADGSILDYPINEFPIFSLVYGDLHPYVITYAINMAILGLLLNLARTTGSGWRALGETRKERVLLLGILGIMIGILIGAHTWDYPVYLGVAAALLAWHSLPDQKNTGTPELLSESEPSTNFKSFFAHLNFIPPALALAVLSFVLYLPFNLSFLGAQAGHDRGGLGTVDLKTPLELFLIALGIYIFFIASFIVFRIIRSRKNLSPLGTPAVLTFLGLAIGTTLIMGGLSLISTWIFLVLLAIGALWILLAKKRNGDQSFAMILLLIALGLGIFCEFFFLIDHYQGGGYERMNTMFKFYTNIWLLMGTAALFSIGQVNRWLAGNRRGIRIWRVLTTAFVIAGMIYPIAAIGSLARGHRLPETLDGAAYILEPVPNWQKSEWRWSLPDLEAIKWIEKNTELDDIILQAVGNAYDWAPRIATFTGRPTLIGWTNHEAGWRNDWKEPNRRSQDTKTIYTTQDLTRARTLLSDYGVNYVMIGKTERDRYPGPGLTKFSSLGELVFSSNEVELYRVNQK